MTRDRLLPEELRRRLGRVGLAIAVVLVGGTAGYMLLEGWTFLEGIYMTVTTIATVGFGEVRPLSNIGRWFTIILIVSGTGVMAFLLGTIVEYVVSGELTGALRRRRVQEAIDQLRDHYIICGHGRVGQEVVHDLEEAGVPVVILDRTAPGEELLRDHQCLAGDASDDQLLVRAGVARARGLVAATGDDNANIVITLTARALNPALVIVARASHPGAEAKLLRAGASHVISPYRIGGRRIATQLLHPRVTDFLDRVMHSREVEFWIEETRVEPASRLAGRPLGEAGIAAATGVNLLALARQGDGVLLTNPGEATRLEAGDVLIGFGTREQLARLARLAGGAASKGGVSG